MRKLVLAGVVVICAVAKGWMPRAGHELPFPRVEWTVVALVDVLPPGEPLRSEPGRTASEQVAEFVEAGRWGWSANSSGRISNCRMEFSLQNTHFFQLALRVDEGDLELCKPCERSTSLWLTVTPADKEKL